MATTKRDERVVRELLVVRLYALQEAKEQLMYAHKSYLQRAYMILRDFGRAGSPKDKTHTGEQSDD